MRMEKNSVSIKFSTQSFSKDEVEFLKHRLNKKYKGFNINSNYKNGTQHVITASTKTATKLFVDIVKYFPPVKRKLDKINKLLNNENNKYRNQSGRGRR